jgi:putative membrane protein
MNLKSCAMVVSFGVVTVLSAGPARGADKAATTPDKAAAAPDKAATAQTAQVLTKLHQSNQMEIAAGKLAQEKGQSKDVKSFGKTLVTDHSAADKKVMALAKEEKIDLPAEAPPPGKMDMLKNAPAADFDKMFASHMLEDHKKDIAEAKEARESTTDPKLKALLASTIPVLEKHRDIAQKLVDKLGPSASMGGGERAVPSAAK